MQVAVWLDIPATVYAIQPSASFMKNLET